MRLILSNATVFALTLCALSASLLEARPNTTASAPPAKQERLSPAAQALNGMTHAALSDAVKQSRQALGPLIMFEEGKMKLFRGDTEVIALPASPPIVYHQLKVIGHCALAIVIQLWRPQLSAEERVEWLTRFKVELLKLSAELPSYDLPAELERSQAQLISLILRLIERASGDERLPREELKSFSRAIRPHLQAAFKHSARVHIDLLHARANELYALLSPEERGKVRGFFYGGRGARVDLLPLQYVSWLIGERTGRESGRVIFSEGVTEKEKGLMSLAKYGVEREIAELIFDDPDALHRDLLGAATRDYLKSFPNAEAAFKSAD